VNIRPLQEGDVEPVVALWHASRRRAHWDIPVHRALTIDDDREYFTERMRPRNDVWVAERDGRLVGFIALEPGWVNQLYVAVDAQRGGVGSALLDHAKTLMDDIRLHTFQANAAARAFYARHGFAEVAFGVSDPPENEPDVLLRWTRAPAAPG
jgi:ribosomal protein S18 acetylase RimI-like enzyme